MVWNLSAEHFYTCCSYILKQQSCFKYCDQIHSVYTDILVHPSIYQATDVLYLVQQVNLNDFGMQEPTLYFCLQQHFITEQISLVKLSYTAKA